MSDIWATISAERGALADDLANLTPTQWNTPSLCSGWTVRDLVAHLSATASLNPGTFFFNMGKAGFNFDRFANAQIEKHRGPDPAATLSEFRSLQNSTSAPPGISHSYPPDAVREVIDSYKGSNMLIGSKKRVAGLALKATDHDWQHGQGEAVEGPLLSLLLAMTGRAAACDDLSGSGVPTLRGRCTPAS